MLRWFNLIFASQNFVHRRKTKYFCAFVLLFLFGKVQQLPSRFLSSSTLFFNSRCCFNNLPLYLSHWVNKQTFTFILSEEWHHTFIRFKIILFFPGISKQMVDLTLRPAIHTKQRMKNVDSRKLMSVLLTLVSYRASLPVPIGPFRVNTKLDADYAFLN